MNIRRAKEKDVPRLIALLYQVQGVHAKGRPDIFKMGAKKYEEAELREILQDETRPIFVAVNEEDTVLGYAFCIYEEVKDSTNCQDMKTVYIDDICVDEACRGQHVGTALYEFVQKYAREQGFYRITLNVWCLNAPAMAFYESCGLKPLKVMMETVL